MMFVSLFGATFPGRSAARSAALQARGPLSLRNLGPGSAVHRFALHRIRDTSLADLR
jgi:hypothetical protein